MVHLLPIKEKERAEKVKERTSQKERAIMLVGKPGTKELPPFRQHLPQLQVQRQLSMDKRRELSSVYASSTGCLRGEDCCIHIRMIQ